MADDKKISDLKIVLIFLVILFLLWFVVIYMPGRTSNKAISDKFIKQPQGIEELETYDKEIKIFNRTY